MFLLFIVLFIGCYGLYKLINDNNNEIKRKQKAIRNGEKYYYDRNGFATDVDTDVAHHTKRLQPTGPGKNPWIKGDVVDINPYTGKIMRNFTQEIRDVRNAEAAKRKQQAIENGDRFYVCAIAYNWDNSVALNAARFDGYAKNELPHAHAMFEEVATGRKYFIAKFECGVYVLWDVKEKRFTTILDKELIPQKNLIELEACINYVTDSSYYDDKYAPFKWVSEIEDIEYKEIQNYVYAGDDGLWAIRCKTKEMIRKERMGVL